MMRWKSDQTILLVCVVLLAVAMLSPVSVQGQDDSLTAKVVTNPADLAAMQAGQAFQFSVELQGSGNGYGYSALILFDADRLEANFVEVPGQTDPVPVNPGPLFAIPPNGQNTMFARNAVILDDPARAGETLDDVIEVAFTYLAPAEPTPNLTGTLFTVTFTVKQAGATSVSLADLRVVQRTGDNQAVDVPIAFEGDLTLDVNGGVQVAMQTCNLNGICDNALGENATNCPEDCEAIAPLTDTTPAIVPPPTVGEEDDGNNTILIALIAAFAMFALLLVVFIVLLVRSRK
jgi:hypothetical protein